MSDFDEKYSDGEDDNYSDVGDNYSVNEENKNNDKIINPPKYTGHNDDVDDAEPESDDDIECDDDEQDGDEQDGDEHDGDDAIPESDDDMTGGDNDSDDMEGDNNDTDDDDVNNSSKKNKKNTLHHVNTITNNPILIDDDDDEDDDYDMFLQKFDQEINNNYINQFHPECLIHNSDEIDKLSKVIRDENNIIVDPLHKTNPYLTKYERTRVLGQRAKQIETGANPFVKVPENIIDSLIIAELELKEKKIPFVIKRPIPGGAFEYWKLKDLEIIHY